MVPGVLLKDMELLPGDWAEASGRLRNGVLIPVAPGPGSDGRTGPYLEMDASLPVLGLVPGASEALVRVRGRWDGEQLLDSTFVQVAAPPWFDWGHQVRLSTADEHGDAPWSEADIRRAADSAPHDKLLASGEGRDCRGIPVARAFYSFATPEAIRWQGSFPTGMIEALAWLGPSSNLALR